jgi:hypothetical protein
MTRRIAGVGLALAAAAALSGDLRVVAAAAVVAVLSAVVLDPPVLRSALRVAAVLTVALTAAVAGAAIALVRGRHEASSPRVGLWAVLILWIAAGVVGRRVDADHGSWRARG